MNAFHEPVLLSHSNNCSKQNKVVGSGGTISHLNLKGYKNVLGKIPCICLGKGIEFEMLSNIT